MATTSSRGLPLGGAASPPERGPLVGPQFVPDLELKLARRPGRPQPRTKRTITSAIVGKFFIRNPLMMWLGQPVRYKPLGQNGRANGDFRLSGQMAETHAGKYPQRDNSAPGKGTPAAGELRQAASPVFDKALFPARVPDRARFLEALWCTDLPDAPIVRESEPVQKLCRHPSR